MPRERPLLDPDNPQHAFAIRLQQLHRHAGKPKQKVLAGALFCSGPRISAFLTGRDFPDWQYVERFVRFCGGDIGEFQKIWEETDETLERLRRTAAASSIPFQQQPSSGQVPPSSGAARAASSSSRATGNLGKPRPGTRGKRSVGHLPQSGVSHLVLMGTSDYKLLPRLPTVSNNLADLASVFTDPTVSDLQSGDVTVCLNPQSMIDFGNALNDPIHAATDLLLVYYSGHGLLGPRRGDLHLAIGPTDSSKPDWTAVPMQAIRDTMLESPARNRVLILDCCFSGRAIQALADDDSVIYGQTEVHGVCTITSTSGNRVSLAVPGSAHSVHQRALRTTE